MPSHPWTLIATFVAVGFVVGSSPAQPSQVDYFPLVVGRSWEYDAVLDPVIGGPRRARATSTMPRSVMVAGETYVAHVTTVNGTPIGDVTEELHYRSVTDGVVRTTNADESDSLFLPRDVGVGDRWETRVGGVELDCEAVTVERVVGADGTVYDECLKVVSRTRSGGAVNDATWFAAGTGVVKKTMKRRLYSIEILLRRVGD